MDKLEAKLHLLSLEMEEEQTEIKIAQLERQLSAAIEREAEELQRRQAAIEATQGAPAPEVGQEATKSGETPQEGPENPYMAFFD